jgi:uncharacterized protein YjiS (DUF1127 family)
MSQKKHQPITYLDQAVSNSRESVDHPAARTPPEMADWDWSKCILSSYALYGAALYPPFLHTLRRPSADAEVGLLNEAGRPIYRPGEAANEAGTKGTVEILPPYGAHGISASSQTVSPLPVLAGEGAPAGWIVTATRHVRQWWQLFQKERDIARAISFLSSMDDRTLHDIGIHRSQIAYVARYGLDDPDRVSTGPS